MSDPTPWIGVGPRTCEGAVLEAFSAVPGIAGEWRWGFHVGRTRTVETPEGITVVLGSHTLFGRVVVAVDDDRGGPVATLRDSGPLETPAQLAARFRGASPPGERADALLGLAAAAAFHRHVSVPELERCIATALDGDDVPLRLIAVRATAVLPAATGHRLLADRADPDNPGLKEWRALYAEKM